LHLLLHPLQPHIYLILYLAIIYILLVVGN